MCTGDLELSFAFHRLFQSGFASAALLLAGYANVQAQANPPTVPVKQAITRGDQLPRTTVLLPVLPSELFALPPAQLAPLLKGIDEEVRGELARFDIKIAQPWTGTAARF